MPELVRVSREFREFVAARSRDDETMGETLHRLAGESPPETAPRDAGAPAHRPDDRPDERPGDDGAALAPDERPD